MLALPKILDLTENVKSKPIPRHIGMLYLQKQVLYPPISVLNILK